jgi:hypothetical protein
VGIVVAAAVATVSAAVAIPTPPERLAARSAIIVEGTVVRTASGYDPDRRTLGTYVTLAVEIVHRGPRGLEEVVLREPGGRFGDLVNVIDAAPDYRLGERVFAFLEPGSDGTLRTAGMFLGKFEIVSEPSGVRNAVRDLSGQGSIPGREKVRLPESFPLADLAAVAVTVPRTRRRAGSSRNATVSRTARTGTQEPSWKARPPEWERLRWDDVQEPGAGGTAAAGGGGSEADGALASTEPGGAIYGNFVALPPSHPTRWHQSDSSTPVIVNIERAGEPLGDPVAAVAEMKRAMAAWSNVPEARVELLTGNDDASFTATHSSSPADRKPSSNIILFGDPYGDIPDPDDNCNGVLAIGGYWRTSTPVKNVNGVSFYPATRMYVIFNNDFECFLGDAPTLAEIATHELGHGLGFGHSSVPDAIMRAYAYGGRGPRLGDDDVDGAHCHYPHDLDLLSPTGGESLAVGSQHEIRWSSSPESGDDPGTVRIDLSMNGGQTWSTLSADEINDGSYGWTVPDDPTTLARIRVRRPTLADSSPTSCSGDTGGVFSIVAPVMTTPGSVPDGTTGAPVTLAVAPNGEITVEWSESCSGEAEEYAIYEGSLDMLRAGSWDHVPVTCSAGTDLGETITPLPGNRFYLVAPVAGVYEGSLGESSGGVDRPLSGAACALLGQGSCDLPSSGSGENHTPESPFPHADHP